MRYIVFSYTEITEEQFQEAGCWERQILKLKGKTFFCHRTQKYFYSSSEEEAQSKAKELSPKAFHFIPVESPYL